MIWSDIGRQAARGLTTMTVDKCTALDNMLLLIRTRDVKNRWIID